MGRLSACRTAAIAALFFLAGTGPSARADYARAGCRAVEPPHGVDLIPFREGGGCSGFTLKTDGRIVSGSLGFVGDGLFFASADGRSVIFVHATPYGLADADLMQKPAIVVFRDGERVASHLFSAVVERPQLLIHSTSHTHWVGGARTRQPSWSAVGATFSFETTTFRRIELDTTTGAIRVEDSEAWKTCDVLAVGGVDMAKDGLRMDRPHALKGQLPKEIRGIPASAFEGPRERFYSGIRMLLCIRGSAESPTSIRLMPEVR